MGKLLHRLSQQVLRYCLEVVNVPPLTEVTTRSAGVGFLLFIYLYLDSAASFIFIFFLSFQTETVRWLLHFN